LLKAFQGHYNRPVSASANKNLKSDIGFSVAKLANEKRGGNA
jgi:hypothetical protein